MRRHRPLPAVLSAALLLAGCGVPASDPVAAGDAPTGVAPGVTLYFVDDAGRLVPQLRETGRLGTVPEALALLLAGPPRDGDVHTEITSAGGVTRVVVTTSPGLMHLAVPLAGYEVTSRGIDQIVCTAVGVAVQRGEPRDIRVRVSLTIPSPESGTVRDCPVIGAGR
ncbi:MULTISPECIES: hypothetical protein [Catenuloplanes]|uniref:GerMN domain-containing protein n=1 Tax=Catenuloplanes niger TaxID=587534 RepID=A0AAE3ZN02_9ACTN|nr:hypothetical protein [Catenuloplanes niger]MDR7321128.1 hypothetical protein [Catenuloplanes niger]